MSDRETIPFETPLKKKKVVLYTYLTGREYEYVQTPLFEAMEMEPTEPGRPVKVGKMNVAKVQDSTHRLLEKMVVSVDGKTDRVVDTLLNMPQEDYQFIVDQVNILTKKK